MGAVSAERWGLAQGLSQEMLWEAFPQPPGTTALQPGFQQGAQRPFAWGPPLLKSQEIKLTPHLYPGCTSTNGSWTVRNIKSGGKHICYLGSEWSPGGLNSRLSSVLICLIRRPCLPCSVLFICFPTSVSQGHFQHVPVMSPSKSVAKYLCLN